MSRQLPKTREEAFAYQFEDDVKILHLMSSRKEDFKKHLAVLQARIDAYNNLYLQKLCEESERKSGVQQQYLKTMFKNNVGYVGQDLADNGIN